MIKFDKQIYSPSSIRAGICELEKIGKVSIKETNQYIECIISESAYDICSIEKELSNYVLCYEVHYGDSHALV